MRENDRLSDRNNVTTVTKRRRRKREKNNATKKREERKRLVGGERKRKKGEIQRTKGQRHEIVKKGRERDMKVERDRRESDKGGRET